MLKKIKNLGTVKQVVEPLVCKLLEDKEGRWAVMEKRLTDKK